MKREVLKVRSSKDFKSIGSCYSSNILWKGVSSKTMDGGCVMGQAFVRKVV